MPPFSALLRLAVTLLAAGAALGLSRVRLPFVDPTLDPGGDPGVLSVAALGITPLIAAYLVVELGACAVPPWSRVRSSPEGRAMLVRAANSVAILFAIIQAAMAALVLARIDTGFLGRPVITSAVPGAQAFVALTMVGGTALLAVLAEVVNRRGLGGGLAVISAAGIGWKLVPEMREHLSGTNPPAIVALAVGTVIATAWLLRKAPAGLAGPTPGARLRHPLAGVFPLNLGAAVLFAIATAGAVAGASWTHSLAPGLTPYVVALGLIGTALGALVARLLAPPGRIAALWKSALGVDARTEADDASSRGLFVAAAFAGGLVVASHVSSRAGGVALGIVPIALLTAIVLDVVEELAARRTQPTLVAVWPLSRPYELEPALALLAREGIPASLRSAHWYTLLPVTGAYAHPSVLVPAADAVRAEAALRRVFAPRRGA